MPLIEYEYEINGEKRRVERLLKHSEITDTIEVTTLYGVVTARRVEISTVADKFPGADAW